MMTRKILVGTALAVLTLGAVLTGCSNTATGTGPATNSTTAPAGQGGHNQADVTFAQQMIPHHRQAVAMANLVPNHTTNPQVTGLARGIRDAQAPEIQQMSHWLTTWGAPTSMPGGDSMPAMPGMNHGSSPGMMTDADMAKLQTLNGTAFDHMWLQMMIRHHQGAIQMAGTEQAHGTDTGAVALAKKIITTQQAEITEMNHQLGRN